MSYRMQRIQDEVLLLASVYGEINYDQSQGSWIHIPYFPLPDNWIQSSTELLLELPPAYPNIPPDGFYIDQGLQTRTGFLVNHYFQQQSHNKYYNRGWAWFCNHIRSWSPSASISIGDNLYKLTELIRAILSEPPRI